MNFSFYLADSAYCDFLRKSDPCVPYTMESKATRPFVGIVLTVSGFSYYAPLTSPKPKHLKMHNQVDFLKINGGVWGAINFNNMIPIHAESLHKVQMNPLPTDSQPTVEYKRLLQNQLSWCNSNRELILKHAEKLYNLICREQARPELRQRCCNYPVDEQQLLIFVHKHNLDMSTLSNPVPAASLKAHVAAARNEAEQRNSNISTDMPKHSKAIDLEH